MCATHGSVHDPAVRSGTATCTRGVRVADQGRPSSVERASAPHSPGPVAQPAVPRAQPWSPTNVTSATRKPLSDVRGLVEIGVWVRGGVAGEVEVLGDGRGAVR